MTLSIVIVNWNTKQLLDDCLNSIYKETAMSDFEIFVADNASSDGSAVMVKEKYPQARLIENKDDLGFGAANNPVLKQAAGRYILLLNPDTVILEHAIDKAVKFMEDKPEASILAPRMKTQKNGNLVWRKNVFPDPSWLQQIILMWRLRYFFPNSKIIKKIQRRGYDFNYEKENEVGGHIEGAFMLIRREVFDKIGFFDEKFFMWFEEVDLLLRAKQAGYKIFYSPEPKIIHYGGEAVKQEMSLLKQKRYNQSLSYYFWKHKPRWQYFVLQILRPASLLLAALTDCIKKRRLNRREHIFWKKWKNIFFLFSLYLSAHFLLLVSKVIMWDGRLHTDFLKQKNYELIYQLVDRGKFSYLYVVYNFLNWLGKGDPVIASNILTFLGWFTAGICVFSILKNFARIGEKNALFIAALFLLSPIFIVRFEMSLSPYSLSNTAFFLGAYSFLRTETAKRLLSKIILQILTVIFFIGAFFINSFLVFYGALLLFSFFLFLKKESLTAEKPPKSRMNIFCKFAKKNIFWILLPFIFYLAQKKIIGSPYGFLEGYNSILFSFTKENFFSILPQLIDRAYQFIVNGFFGPIIFSISSLQRKIFFAIFLIFSASLFFLDKKYKALSPSSEEGEAGVSPKNIFIWGVIIFFFGALAYILVGKAPFFPYGSGFAMRHGLILPLGSSLIILALIDGLLNNRARRTAKIIILAIFITYNIYNYYNVNMDGYRQLGIIQGIREKYNQGQISEKDIFIFYDKFPGYTWAGRTIRTHEYTAYLYEATGDQKLMGTGADGGLDEYMMWLKGQDKLNFEDKRAAERFKNIIITPPSFDQGPTVKNFIKLKIADLFLGKAALLSTVKSLIGANVEITTSTPKETSWLDKYPAMQRK